ncbi:Ribosomal protein L11 methyltransferase [Starkeya nomas]|uniref:Ribosomal protein L11 methyltransferase n=1 Tax=Starkeya nomas TaxID=2666134 RepID=A0A5S9PER8_9HYPH|nr:methyltransferase [Starkeya nomas]CAA0102250.1 Ribosomal protein L11 methyltransferase [Starkeya nomas]
MTPRAADDPHAFIREQTRLIAPPLVPEILLHLAEESLPIWQRTEEELGEIGLPPPYWAFAWAGGQALARHVLDHPEIVRGKRVLDFAAGSGLVGIAAGRAGARAVEAADIDRFAHAAIALNATENATRNATAGATPGTTCGITVLAADIVGIDGGWDVVLAGDIAYERDLAERVFAWLESLAARGAEVWIGDPGRSYLPRERLEKIAEYGVPVSRDLEDTEIKRTSVWRPRGRPGG